MIVINLAAITYCYVIYPGSHNSHNTTHYLPSNTISWPRAVSSIPQLRSTIVDIMKSVAGGGSLHFHKSLTNNCFLCTKILWLGPVWGYSRLSHSHVRKNIFLDAEKYLHKNSIKSQTQHLDNWTEKLLHYISKIIALH